MEDNIKEINHINDNIKKRNINKDINIEYIIEEGEINNMMNNIQNLGKIININKGSILTSTNKALQDDSKDINKNEMKNLENKNDELVYFKCAEKIELKKN